MTAIPAIAPKSSAKLVEYKAENGIATLTMVDPPANTYTHEMMRDLDEAILQARVDDDAHVIVLRGAGDKFFSAGANIKMLASVTPRFKYFFCLHANETLNRLEHTPKLVIAALNGHTVGGGLEIAMAADLRIGWRNTGAPKDKQPALGLPEVNLGVLPGTGGTQRLVRIVGKSKAIEMMISGRNYSFDEGLQWGVVSQIVEAPSAEEFMKKVYTIAAEYCPPNKASKAVGLIKRACQSGAEVPFESALAIERELQQQLFQSEDAKEGIGAYNAKRKAVFKGK
jgi:enoyl-CoA hydratase/carnithine racemase